MRLAGNIIFNGWFDKCGGTPQCPRGSLLSSIIHPLALPIFNLQINNDLKFDTLFGRIHVCFGFNLEGFLGQCKKSGLEVRFATNNRITSYNVCYTKLLRTLSGGWISSKKAFIHKILAFILFFSIHFGICADRIVLLESIYRLVPEQKKPGYSHGD